MKTWVRVERDVMCGYCQHRPIAIGEPAMRIMLPNLKRERWRCTDCAGDAPPELPPLIQRMFIPKAMARLGTGVRVPGEEG